MNYILLDLDGVMITTPSWRMAEMLDDGFSDFNPRAVVQLNRIITQTSIAIILTTSHRHSYSVEAWHQLFEKRAILHTVIEIMLSTNDFTASRASQISEWYQKEGKEKNFVAIDDDTSLNGLDTEIKSRCVLTKPMVGLDEPSADLAIQILNGS